MIVNVLRYGELIAHSDREAPTGNSSSQSLRANKRNGPEVIAELRRIYANHCRGKSPTEIDDILSRFRGRETLLLAKVKAKYVTTPPTSAYPY